MKYLTKKELFWLIFCGAVYSFCFLAMAVLTFCKLTSQPYWYENLLSLFASPCLVYGLLKLGQLIGRVEKSKSNIEKLIDEETRK